MSQTFIQSCIMMLHSMSMVMENGASNQKNGQTISTASTAVTCAMIIKKGAG